MDDSSQSELARSNGAFCRLCFSQVHELHRIFPPTGAPNRLLVRKIEYCTGIGVSFGADSNASICAKCVGLTEELFRFKQLCGANERWLKMDAGGEHVAEELLMPPAARPDSCASLLTIETEQLEEGFRGCGEDVGDPLKHSIEVSKPALQDQAEMSAVDSNRVTSSGSCMRARRPTTIRSVPVVASNAVTIKSEIESDTSDTREESEASSQDRNNTPSCDASTDTEGYRASSTAFTLVPGTKSRRGRLYLVYKGYRYSNSQGNGNVYWCTHRTPDYCRAKVLLKDNRVFEINDNKHQHKLPRQSKRRASGDPNPQTPKKKDVKISLVLKKHLPEREASRRHSGTTLKGTGLESANNNWFIKANRKTVDGFTYTFCGLRKDGVIRLKCITKGCGSHIYMCSNGDLTGTHRKHNHPPHSPI
ncbi:hypothetical protein quinque_013250 [Culex quinquefasciatus]